MAPDEFNLGAAKQSLESVGFSEFQDGETGKRIRTFESKGSPFGTLPTVFATKVTPADASKHF